MAAFISTSTALTRTSALPCILTLYLFTITGSCCGRGMNDGWIAGFGRSGSTVRRGAEEKKEEREHDSLAVFWEWVCGPH